MKVVNLALQRPASGFSGGRWYLDTPPFQRLVGRVVVEDEPDAVNGYTREEVSSRKSQEGGLVFQGTWGDFFRPPSPPPQGGRRDGKYNCRRAGLIVDAGHEWAGRGIWPSEEKPHSNTRKVHFGIPVAGGAHQLERYLAMPYGYCNTLYTSSPKAK